MICVMVFFDWLVVCRYVSVFVFIGKKFVVVLYLGVMLVMMECLFVVSVVMFGLKNFINLFDMLMLCSIFVIVSVRLVVDELVGSVLFSWMLIMFGICCMIGMLNIIVCVFSLFMF